MIFQFYYWHALNLTARGNFRLGYFWSIFMFLGLFHQTSSVLACALCYLKICKISRSLMYMYIYNIFYWPWNNSQSDQSRHQTASLSSDQCGHEKDATYLWSWVYICLNVYDVIVISSYIMSIVYDDGCWLASDLLFTSY